MGTQRGTLGTPSAHQQLRDQPSAPTTTGRPILPWRAPRKTRRHTAAQRTPPKPIDRAQRGAWHWATRLLQRAPANESQPWQPYNPCYRARTVIRWPHRAHSSQVFRRPHAPEIHQRQGTGRRPQHRPIFPPDLPFPQAGHEVDQGVQPNTRGPRARRLRPANTGILRRAQPTATCGIPQRQGT